MDLWLWLWSLRRSSSGEDSSHLSFPGHVQPTGNSNIRDINHHAFAKHLTCFVLNEVSKITTQHVDDSPCLWKRPLSGLQKHNTNLGHYILVCKPEKVTKPHNMWLIFFKMVRKKKRPVHIMSHSFKFDQAQYWHLTSTVSKPAFTS